MTPSQSDVLTPVEFEALRWLIQGNLPALETLRRQAASIRVVSRTDTVVGFVTELHAETDLRLDAVEAVLPDVFMISSHTQFGLAFTLWISEGQLCRLEGVSFIGNWPDDLSNYRFIYQSGEVRDLNEIQRALG